MIVSFYDVIKIMSNKLVVRMRNIFIKILFQLRLKCKMSELCHRQLLLAANIAVRLIRVVYLQNRTLKE